MTSRDIRKIIICYMLMKSASIILCGNCDPDEHYCEGTKKCIDSDYICDGDNDCGDNSDEREELCFRHIFLEQTTVFTETVEYSSKDCQSNQFACTEGSGSKCIQISWVCDGDWDCLHGSDERHCSQSSSTNPYTSTTPLPTIIRQRHPFIRFYNLTTLSPPQRCTNNQFRCPDGCINKSWACDGEQDCRDGSDESPQICSGPSSLTTQSTSIRSYNTPPVTPIHTTRIDSSTNGNVHSKSVLSSDEKASEDCDVQASSSISCNLWNWIQCALLVVGIIFIIAIVVFVCKKCKSRSAGLNSRNTEDRQQAVSFLNSNIIPECQLVLVSTPVQVQSTVVQSAPSVDYPPPYDTQPSSTQIQMQNSTKAENCLL